CEVFGIVTRGRVQLELRDGEPGPVLGRDAGLWLRGAGVRALRNPGRSTAWVRILTPGSGPSPARQHTPYASYRMRRNDMNSMNDSGVVAGLASGQTSHRLRGLAVTGFVCATASGAAPGLASAQPSHRLRGLAVTGLFAALTAMAATTVAAALAQAVAVA